VPPGHNPAERPDSASVTRVLHMDASGRVVHDPGNGDPRSIAPDAEPISLSDILPESATIDLMAAIRAAADTGNAQFLEFDLLSEDGLRRIHAEAAPDPEHQGEFVVTSREYSDSDDSELIRQARDVDLFAAFCAEARERESVFTEFARVLAVHLTYDQLNIVTVDTDRDQQHVLFSTEDDLDAVVPLSGTAVQVVSRTNERLVVPTAIPSVIVVPLRSSGETLAYVSVHSKAWESFDDDELEVVSAFCPSVAAAMAADTYRKFSSRSVLEQSTLQAISAVSAAAGDLDTMLQVVADRIHRNDRFAYVRIEAFVTEFTAGAGSNILATRGVDSVSTGDVPDFVEDRTPRSWSKVIGAGSEPLGNFCVDAAQTVELDHEDQEFLSECARRLAHGIERIKTEDALERLRTEIDASREIERATAGLSDLVALVEIASEEIVRLAEPAFLKIRVTQPGSNESRHEHKIADPLSPGGPQTGDSVGLSTASVSLISPAGVVGDIQAAWNSSEEARTGLRRLEAMTPRLAERINALLLMEQAASDSRDNACLAEIESAILRCTDPALALEEATSILSDRLQGARISISALEPDGSAFSEISVSGFPIPGWADGSPRQLQGSLEETLVLGTGPVTSAGSTPDALVARWPSEAQAIGAGVQSLVSAAIPTGDTVSAWLSARSPQITGFGEGDVNLLGRAATLMAGAVLRHGPISSATTSGSEMEILARIGHISQSAGGVEVPYARFSAELAGLVEFGQIEIAELGPSRDVAWRVYLSGKPVPGWEAGSEFALPGTVTEAVVRSRTGLLVTGQSDTEMAGRFPAQAAALAAELRALVAAPLVIDGEPVGSLIVRSMAPEAYSQKDLVVVEAVAVHISAAVARGRLQKRIERQRHESEALATMGS
jgi:GAF domain-containing protein